VAWEQFALPLAAPERPRVAAQGMPALVVEETPERIAVRGADFRLAFDKAAGALATWHYRGLELLKAGPRLAIWRAPTDNDANTWGEQKAAIHWREVGLDRLVERVLGVTCAQVGASVAQVVVRSRVAAPDRAEGFDCAYTYTIYGSGDVLVEAQVLPTGALPPLPRVGLQLTLPAAYDTFTWYGRGPHESYADRKASAAVGLYSGAVDAQYFPYVKPQENGNKTDVRWAALNEAGGVGLLAVGDPTFSTSVHHFTAEDLTAANHTHEIARRPDVTWHIDHAQSGLGNGSCGPGTLDRYLLWPAEMRFNLRLRPFVEAAAEALALAKEVID
jgi:hypothetical protein